MACQKAADATLSPRKWEFIPTHKRTFEIERCRCVRFRNTIWLMLLKFFIKSYMRFWYDMNDIVCDIVYSTRADVKHMFDSITATFTHTRLCSTIQFHWLLLDAWFSIFKLNSSTSIARFAVLSWREIEKLAWQWQTSLQCFRPHGKPP